MRRESYTIGILCVAVAFAVIFAAPLGRIMRQSFGERAYSEGNAHIAQRTVCETEQALSKSLRDARAAPPAIPAFVYSNYPFNFKDELLISGGAARGMKKGDGVTAGEMLLGTIYEVFRETALVRTIFDARTRFAVRIGEKGADALLVGGSTPRVTLIAKNADIREGDVIYAVYPGMPYGMPVGTLVRRVPSSDSLFDESAIQVPLNPADIRAVAVLPSLSSE